jgi:hypothetical protein
MLLPFGVLFLDHLFKSIFLHNCAKDCAFLGCSEVGFLVSILLVSTTILCVVLGMRTPMYLAQVAMLLIASFLGNFVSRLHTGSLVSFPVFRRSFLDGLCIGEEEQYWW